jgi:microcystin-dependent protein
MVHISHNNTDIWIHNDAKYKVACNNLNQVPLFLDRFKDSNKVGTIMPWPNRNTGAPSGWLLCDGSEYPGPGASGYDVYWQLYQEIGTTYNTGGETSNHFRVPNLQNRLLGRGAAIGNQGQTFGSDPGNTNNASLSNSHLPIHNHSVGYSGNTNTSTNMNRSNNQYRTGSGSRNWKQFTGFNRRTIYNSNSTGGSGGSGNNHSHSVNASNRQLDLTTKYIIKYKYTVKDDNWN